MMTQMPVAHEKDQSVEHGDPVHLEKSGLGDHAGLDDSNVLATCTPTWKYID